MEKAVLKHQYTWIEVAVIVAMIRFFIDYGILMINYFARTNWNSGINFTVISAIVNIGIFYYSIIYFRNKADINQHSIFKITFLSLILIYTLYIAGFVFLHYYLDTNYKHQLADIAVEQHIERSRQIQENNNIIMDDDSEMIQKEVLKQYAPQQILIDYVLYIVWSLLLAAIIASIYKNIYHKNQEEYY